MLSSGPDNWEPASIELSKKVLQLIRLSEGIASSRKESSGDKVQGVVYEGLLEKESERGVMLLRIYCLYRKRYCCCRYSQSGLAIINAIKQINRSQSGTSMASDQLVHVSFPSGFDLPAADHEVSHLQLFPLYCQWAVDSALR